MKKLEIREILKKGIENRQKIKIIRRKIDDEPINCFPLSLGQKFLLVQYEYDFQLDGFKVMRMKDITSVRSDEVERFTEHILKQEGIFNSINQPFVINLNNWKSIFEALKDSEKNIIIECEEVDDGRFFIGKISEIYKDSLSFLHFDGLGRWSKESTRILFKDITMVNFDDRYSTILSKYIHELT